MKSAWGKGFKQKLRLLTGTISDVIMRHFSPLLQLLFLTFADYAILFFPA
jgi:hypothetical protein